MSGLVKNIIHEIPYPVPTSSASATERQPPKLVFVTASTWYPGSLPAIADVVFVEAYHGDV
jgi:hypothetical protein